MGKLRPKIRTTERRETTRAGTIEPVNDYASLIRTVPDFPKPGILFRDITPVLASHKAFAQLTTDLATPWEGWVDTVVAVESRGFILGTAIARELGIGFVLARKPGKLPLEQVTKAYDLEYGSASLGIVSDALAQGERVLIVDDLLATGGTAAAAAHICAEIGANVVGFSFAIELTGLGGRAILEKTAPVHSALFY